ncbi:hypothetical protein FSP39_011792 [Pinctada imbricata]|uniref:Uncharacterized protein n=1 Tax=Pinctada imbricata TaxID=66713 RepID=A0AA88YI97_PINIB|nr:hypothetical protein FSP39_011792 [Pinctada imbricata]
MKAYITYFVIFMTFVACVYGQTPQDFKDWMASDTWSTYNKKIFPRSDQTENITVDVKFYLIAITDFDELGGQMESVGYIVVKWTNDFLTWNTPANLTQVLLPQENFWLPSMVVSNSVQSLNEQGHKSYRVKVKNTGECEWIVGVVSRTACPVDVSYYPFDKQECEVIFNPWGYNDNQISLMSSETEVDLSHYMGNVEWDITSTAIESKSISSSSYLKFKINISRIPGFFLVNMVVPILILGLLNGLVFLLPADSGERVGFAITAFLTFAVFLTMVSENLPKAAQPMSLLCYFLTLMLVMSAISTLITIMTMRVYHQDADSDVPKWLRHVVSFITCRKCKKWCKRKKKRNRDNDDSDDSSDDEEDELDEAKTEKKEDVFDDLKGISWKNVGVMLDMFFFMLFIIGTVVISVFFLIPLATSS